MSIWCYKGCLWINIYKNKNSKFLPENCKFIWWKNLEWLDHCTYHHVFYVLQQLQNPNTAQALLISKIKRKMKETNALWKKWKIAIPSIHYMLEGYFMWIVRLRMMLFVNDLCKWQNFNYLIYMSFHGDLNCVELKVWIFLCR